jgi:hypothetical protein
MIKLTMDAILPFTCYSYWFSCYFDQRGKLMKAPSTRTYSEAAQGKDRTYQFAPGVCNSRYIIWSCLKGYGTIARSVNLGDHLASKKVFNSRGLYTQKKYSDIQGLTIIQFIYLADLITSDLIIT